MRGRNIDPTAMVVAAELRTRLPSMWWSDVLTRLCAGGGGIPLTGRCRRVLYHNCVQELVDVATRRLASEAPREPDAEGDGWPCRHRVVSFDRDHVAWVLRLYKGVMNDRRYALLPEPVACVPVMLRIQEKLKRNAYLVGDRHLLCLLVDLWRAGKLDGRCVPTKHELLIRDLFPHEFDDLVYTWTMVSTYETGRASIAEWNMCAEDK